MSKKHGDLFFIGIILLAVAWLLLPTGDPSDVVTFALWKILPPNTFKAVIGWALVALVAGLAFTEKI